MYRRARFGNVLTHACERSFYVLSVYDYRNVVWVNMKTWQDVTLQGRATLRPSPAPRVSRENIAYATIECESVAYLPYDDNLSANIRRFFWRYSLDSFSRILYVISLIAPFACWVYFPTASTGIDFVSFAGYLCDVEKSQPWKSNKYIRKKIFKNSKYLSGVY